MTVKLVNIGALTTFDHQAGMVVTHHCQDVLIKDGKISAIGKTAKGELEIDCNQKLVTPGFIDSHTHPVFLKGRENEFSQRLSGETYQEIAASGGGIRSSVNGVRTADQNLLLNAVEKRLDRFLKLGTTTIEAKSGYGLSLESELKSLKIIDELNEIHPIDIYPTFMGAHAFPFEYANNHDDYVELLCNEMIPAVAKQGIAVFCDVFCENGYFTVDQSRKILKTAASHGLKPRIHADEFADSGAAELAAELNAMSADHLMAVSDAGIEALAGSEVIATLLPGTTFFLGQKNYAPARKLIDAGIRIALASDFNPGSCHIQSMPFIISLACINMGLSVEESFTAATYRAAEALGIADTVGTINIGRQADLILWDIDSILEIPYNVTDLPIQNVLKNGQPIFTLD